MSVAAAATAALTFAALYAGHQVGDHIVQTNHQAVAKGAPSNTALITGRRSAVLAGWPAIAGHVVSYLAVQAAALALIAPVGGPTRAGAVAALLISGVTHAVIDRRWLVAWLLRRTGSGQFAEQPTGMYLADQSLHHAALLLAAVTAAAVTAWPPVAAVAAAGAVVLAAMLAGEMARAEWLRSDALLRRYRRAARTAEPARWVLLVEQRAVPVTAYATLLAGAAAAGALGAGYPLRLPGWLILAAPAACYVAAQLAARAGRRAAGVDTTEDAR